MQEMLAHGRARPPSDETLDRLSHPRERSRTQADRADGAWAEPASHAHPRGPRRPRGDRRSGRGTGAPGRRPPPSATARLAHVPTGPAAPTARRRRARCAARSRGWSATTRRPTTAETAWRTTLAGTTRIERPGRARAQRPVRVLGVGEQRLVEPADALGRGARDDQHRAAARAVGRVRRRRLPEGAAGRSLVAVPCARAAGRTRRPRTRRVRRVGGTGSASTRPPTLVGSTRRRRAARGSPARRSASLLSSSTWSAPSASAASMPAFMPPAKPRFSSSRTSADVREAPPRRRRRCPSLEPLSTTTTDERAGTWPRCSERRQARVSSRPFHESTTAVTRDVTRAPAGSATRTRSPVGRATRDEHRGQREPEHRRRAIALSRSSGRREREREDDQDDRDRAGEPAYRRGERVEEVEQPGDQRAPVETASASASPQRPASRCPASASGTWAASTTSPTSGSRRPRPATNTSGKVTESATDDDHVRRQRDDEPRDLGPDVVAVRVCRGRGRRSPRPRRRRTRPSRRPRGARATRRRRRGARRPRARGRPGSAAPP